MTVMSPRVPPVTLTRPLRIHLTFLKDHLQDTQSGDRVLCSPIPPGSTQRWVQPLYPWDFRELWASGSPTDRCWEVHGVTLLWPSTAHPKGLCEVSPPWGTREKAQEPWERRPAHPFHPRGNATPTRPRSAGPTPRREMPRPCVAPPAHAYHRVPVDVDLPLFRAVRQAAAAQAFAAQAVPRQLLRGALEQVGCREGAGVVRGPLASAATP